MLWSVDSCQNNVSADQYRDHITSSGFELIKDYGLWTQVRLICKSALG